MKHSAILWLALLAAALLVAGQVVAGEAATPASKKPAAAAGTAAVKNPAPATTAPKGKDPAPATTAPKGKDPAPAATAPKAPKPPAVVAKPPYPPEPPPMPKTPPPGVIDPGEAGKVIYKDQPTSIVTLFLMYRQTQAELKWLGEKEKFTRDRLNDIQRGQTLARKELTNQETPVRIEMAKMKNKERDVRKTLAEREPREQPPLQMPRPPVRRSTSYSGDSDTSGYDSYQADYARWQADCQRIQQQNEQNRKKYQQDMAEYKAKQAKGKQDIADLAAKVKDLDTKLDELEKEFTASQTDTVTAAKGINDELQSISRQATVVTNRQETLADTIRGAPENIRLAAGIVDWEETLYALSELKALYSETQGAINEVHASLKEDAEKAGRTLAADWRHPQQDRMDALKALIEKATAAQAAVKATKPAK